MSSSQWVETEWYPRAVKHAQQGFLWCDVDHGRQTYADKLSRRGMTSCYTQVLDNRCPYRTVNRASWDGATRDLGKALYDISRSVREPLKEELQAELEVMNHSPYPPRGTAAFTSAVKITLSQNYPPKVVESVFQETYPHGAVDKLRSDGVPSYIMRFCEPRQQQRITQVFKPKQR